MSDVSPCERITECSLPSGHGGYCHITHVMRHVCQSCAGDGVCNGCDGVDSSCCGICGGTAECLACDGTGDLTEPFPAIERERRREAP